ncbi:Bax inhibitor-1/YccA family protein [Phenylobacterium soli]|uniref:BAX inhibitor (BI)-1/YccA family protein n=1 Tax=Phenylobacterium soli TaxID=2170551 RepID=A0A328ALH3_9CAUL|nr:Bax inhibitor-1/YccA family protein [Phenylobacterium soli]RAK53708.1 BAX inhibitor (BI)-1/YccA family protein [Phenylobacterium soli]
MSDFNRGYARTIPADRADMSVDAGLRSFMLGVYNKMALGLLLSAVLAWLTADFAPVQQLLYVVSPEGRLVGFTGLGTIIRFLPLAVLIGAMFMRNPSPRSASIVYWSVVSAIGAGLGVWLLAYTGSSVALTFLITASAFGALSLFGYTTKKDLTGFGSFLIMGLWGLVIASLVGMFWHPAGFSFIISLLGVLIFSGLVAYDTQRLKMTYYALGGDTAGLGVATSYGALNLYLNFINLFQFLLQFMGNRR